MKKAKSIDDPAESLKMLGYRRRSFKTAFQLIRELSVDPGKLVLLLELQELLISEITRAEDKIRTLKLEFDALSSTNKEDKKKIKRSIYVINKISHVQNVRYIWKCFGDAIAFTYLDSFSLKHAFYNTKNYNPKQEAGFITGKDGLSAELATLRNILSLGVPCLLVDLTNTIRYGDICLLTGPDPYLVEVKSSGRLNARAKKQLRNIKKLHNFYETDAASDFRGGHQSWRAEASTTPQMYVAEFNECIHEAYAKGYSVVQPEKALFLIAITDNKLPMEKIFANIQVGTVWAISLNESKSSRAWAPYRPFTLSMQSEGALYDFIKGELHLFAFLDFDVLCELTAREGYRMALDLEDREFPLRLSKDETEGHAKISSHILRRSALELLSPAWIIRTSLEGFERTINTKNRPACIDE